MAQTPLSRKARRLQELLLYMAKALVDTPSAVTVEVLEIGTVCTLELRVAPKEFGQVIGKAGQTAEALRKIIGAVGTSLEVRATVNIIDT